MDYKKVIEDFNSGKLNRKTTRVVMDNDGGYWDNDTEDEDRKDHELTQLETKYGSPGGYSDVVDILRAAGVPTEWC